MTSCVDAMMRLLENIYMKEPDTWNYSYFYIHINIGVACPVMDVAVPKACSVLVDSELSDGRLLNQSWVVWDQTRWSGARCDAVSLIICSSPLPHWPESLTVVHRWTGTADSHSLADGTSSMLSMDTRFTRQWFLSSPLKCTKQGRRSAS